MGIKTVDERLTEAAALFKERNAAYGNEFVAYGTTLHTMFPDGVTINTPELWQRIYGIILMQMKLRRYAKNTTTGGHADSLEDLSVYAQMSAYTDALAHDAHAQVMAVVNETAPEWKQVPARDLLDGDTIVVGVNACKIIKIRFLPHVHITLDNGVVIEPHKNAWFHKKPDDAVGGGRDSSHDHCELVTMGKIIAGDTIVVDGIERMVMNNQYAPTQGYRTLLLNNGNEIEAHISKYFHMVRRAEEPSKLVGGGRDLETPIPPAQNQNWDNIFAHNIRTGDIVLDWDEVEQKVTDINRFGLTEFFRVDFADGTHVLLSRYKNIRRLHPTSTVPEETTKWVPAQELRTGDILRTSSGDHHIINTAPSFSNSHVRIRLSNEDLIDLHATTLFKIVLPTDPA